MQVLTIMKAVSVALAAGALSFLMAEWRFYRNAFQDARHLSHGAPDTGRLLRRTFGSAVLLAMSILMFMGKLPVKGQSTPDEVLQLFYYWTAIVGLAVVLAATALYDALSGVKRLGNYVSTVEGKELARLAKQLKEAQQEGGLLAGEPVEAS